MKKLLIGLFSILLFFGQTKVANAIDCTFESTDIYVNITPITLNCTGVQDNKQYVAMIYAKNANGSNKSSTSHCAGSINGKVSILITARHTAEDYYVVVKNPHWAPGCNGTGSPLTPEYKITVKDSVSVPASTTCQNNLGEGMETALGCIPTKPDKFVSWILKNAIGMGGGIAFLLIIWGAFQVLTSGGSPEKLNNGKDVIVSAISGLLLIIFSVVILKLIGVDIFGIPGFNP